MYKHLSILLSAVCLSACGKDAPTPPAPRARAQVSIRIETQRTEMALLSASIETLGGPWNSPHLTLTGPTAQDFPNALLATEGEPVKVTFRDEGRSVSKVVDFTADGRPWLCVGIARTPESGSALTLECAPE